MRHAKPRVGPVAEDLMLVELRHIFDTGAINAAERAVGSIPGGRKGAVAYACM